MRKFKYVGPHDSVDLVGVGTVQRGDVVDADPELGARLEEQPGNWQHIPIAKSQPAKKAAAKKAPAKKAAAKKIADPPPNPPDEPQGDQPGDADITEES